MPLTATELIAKQLKDLYDGNNWTASSFKPHLRDVTWQEATTKIADLNTIAGLVYHINYYVLAATKVLDGGPLDSHDKYSFDHPPIQSAEDWEALLTKIWSDADVLRTKIEQLSDTRLQEVFVDEKYGDFYRNLQGIIEHTYYHLGQIVVIKKLVRNK